MTKADRSLRREGGVFILLPAYHVLFGQSQWMCRFFYKILTFDKLSVIAGTEA